jgi:hypothetical protein
MPLYPMTFFVTFDSLNFAIMRLVPGEQIIFFLTVDATQRDSAGAPAE